MVSTWAYIALFIGMLIFFSLLGSYTRIQTAKYIGANASTAQINRYYDMKTFSGVIGILSVLYVIYIVKFKTLYRI